MQGKLVVRYEMTDKQLAGWKVAAGIPDGALTGTVVSSVRARVEELLAGSPLGENATIEVSYK